MGESQFKQLWLGDRRREATHLLETVFRLGQHEANLLSVDTETLVRAMCGLASDAQLNPVLLRIAIGEAAAAGERTLDHVERRAVALQQRRNDAPIDREKQITVSLPIWENLATPDMPATVVVRDHRISIEGNIAYRRRIPDVEHARLLKAHADYPFVLARPWFFTTHVAVRPGDDFTKVWLGATAAIGLLHDIVEFVLQGSLITCAAGPTFELPRHYLRPPKWVSAIAEDQPVYILRINPLLDFEDRSGVPCEAFSGWLYGLEPRPAQGALWPEVERIAAVHRTGSDQSSLRGLLADCLRLFAEAVRQVTSHWALLGLWRMAERLCLLTGPHARGKRRGREHDHRSHVSWRLPNLLCELSGPERQGARAALQYLGRRRNEVVHVEQNPLTFAGDVEVLRRFCHAALLYVHSNIGKLDSIEALNDVLA